MSSTVSAEEVADVIRKAFRAVQTRDEALAGEVFADDVDLHWPPELPYGGSSRSGDLNKSTWSQTWDPLQPTEAERDLEFRIVAVGDDEAVVLWTQKGRAPSGERIDTPVLGLYEVREGKLRRGQMFYFNPSEVVRFVAEAGNDQMSAPK